MSYVLERFGAITLPLYNRTHSMPPADALPTVVRTTAGAFDNAGSERAGAALPMQIRLTATIYDDAPAVVRSQVDALRAAVRTRGWLYRRADDDGDLQRCLARLVSVDDDRKPNNRRHFEVKATWQALTLWQGLRAEDWTLDDGESFDDGLYLDTGEVLVTPPGSSEITIGSNLPTTDVRLTVVMDGTDADPVYVVIPQTNVALAVAGPWAAADVLVIDAPSRTITLNGAAAYSRLDLESGYAAYDHLTAEWLILQPGINDVLVVGGAIDSATVAYTEVWA